MDYVIFSVVVGIFLALPVLLKADSIMIFFAAMSGSYLYSNLYSDTFNYARNNLVEDTDVIRAVVALLLTVLPALLVLALTVNKHKKQLDRFLDILVAPASVLIIWGSLKYALPPDLANTVLRSEVTGYSSDYFIYALIVALVATTLHLILSKPKKDKKDA